MDLKIYNIGLLGLNTYLLTDKESKESILIDLGGEYNQIIDDIKALGTNLKYILNTHGHFDHVLCEKEFQNEYPEIPIYINKEDQVHLNNLKDEIKWCGLTRDIEAPTPTKYIDENSELFIGKNKIKIFHTPGHSKGSLCFYIDGKLFAGDTLFQRSIGRTDLYDGDYDSLIESVKTKLFNLPDDTIVYPGHGPKTTIGEEKKYNTYLK